MITKNIVGIMACIAVLFSCDKVAEVNYQEEDLIGVWQRTDVIPSGLSEADFRYFDMELNYTFNSDGTYSYKVNFYGFKDENPDEIIGQSENLGTFEIKGDSLFIKDLQNTSWEKGFNPEPDTTYFENAASYGSRFEVKEDVLTLYYISYPADAPVKTQMSYERVD